MTTENSIKGIQFKDSAATLMKRIENKSIELDMLFDKMQREGKEHDVISLVEVAILRTTIEKLTAMLKLSKLNEASTLLKAAFEQHKQPMNDKVHGKVDPFKEEYMFNINGGGSRPLTAQSDIKPEQKASTLFECIKKNQSFTVLAGKIKPDKEFINLIKQQDMLLNGGSPLNLVIRRPKPKDFEINSEYSWHQLAALEEHVRALIDRHMSEQCESKKAENTAQDKPTKSNDEQVAQTYSKPEPIETALSSGEVVKSFIHDASQDADGAAWRKNLPADLANVTVLEFNWPITKDDYTAIHAAALDTLNHPATRDKKVLISLGKEPNLNFQFIWPEEDDELRENIRKAIVNVTGSQNSSNLSELSELMKYGKLNISIVPKEANTKGSDLVLYFPWPHTESDWQAISRTAMNNISEARLNDQKILINIGMLDPVKSFKFYWPVNNLEQIVDMGVAIKRAAGSTSKADFDALEKFGKLTLKS